jgi:hypothetical protein
VFNAVNFVCDYCTFKSTGSVTSDTSAYIWGLNIFSSSAIFNHTLINDGTIGGYQIKIDTGATNKPITIKDGDFEGSAINALYVTSSSSSDSTGNVDISNSTVKNVTDAMVQTGQTGNGIVLSRVSNSNVFGNYISHVAYAGIRLSGGSSTANSTASYNYVGWNSVDSAGETSIYAELGAELNTIAYNFVTHCMTGLHGTNLSQRPTGSKNLFLGNRVVGCLGYGVEVEHDDLIANYFMDTPIGVVVGFGGTGRDIALRANTFRNSGTTGAHPMQVPISVDAGLTSGVNNLGIVLSDNTYENIPNSMPGAIPTLNNEEPVAVITGITQANPAVITVIQAPSPGFAAGQTWLVSQVSGMTQINGLLCTESAHTTTTITCGGAHAIDSTGFSAFAQPLNRQGPLGTIYPIWDSGTTFHSSWPSQVSNPQALTAADARGTVTLAAGAGTHNWATTLFSAPTCTANDTTAANSVKASTTTTALTLAGTTTDVISFQCSTNF